ncbi:MAG: hypothetical protein ACPGLV_09340 [Bacteroidia bacterium]
MSVSRSIEVKLFTNFVKPSDLLKELVDDVLSLKDENDIIQSYSIDDIEEFEFIPFESEESLFETLDARENRNLSNYILLYNSDISEMIHLHIENLNDKNDGFGKGYSLTFSPLVGKRLECADRLTDYGYYLNMLVPRILRSNSKIKEIICEDYDWKPSQH